ncbi:VWA domain-containing protein [Ruminococcus flavefaciens]|uniref:VWA domain-containing protein n=1 Tax=Ruminococcus flavefaciens TaxID=1265 RepID=UPI000465CB1A|nr:VWA domain-containing protein [Ruminococcus flavefaciens]
MNKKIGLIAVIVIAFMLTLNIPITAFAASNAVSDGIETDLMSNKEVFSNTDDMKFTFSAKNTNTYDINGASVKLTIPEGLKLKSGELTSGNITLKSGEQFKKEITLVKNGPTALQKVNSPKTGDDSHISTILFIMLALGAGSFLLRKNRKASRTILSFMICAGFITSVSPLNAFSADKTTISIDKTIKVSGNAYTVKAEMSFTVPETDTAASYTVSFAVNGGSEIADQTVAAGNFAVQPKTPVRDGFSFAGWYADQSLSQIYDFDTPVNADTTIYAMWTNEIDKNGNSLPDCLESNDQTMDTDNDGITDYQEIMFLNTDTRKKDTDGNGVLDKDEDSDNDGIININEFKIGTNPLKFDTDEDDLTDSEEKAIGTDPLNEDTDGDGASDGWEKTNGFDPLNADQSFVIKKTDGAMSIELECEGKYAAEFEAEQISNVFLNDTIPGYTSPAYDFTLDGNPFISAKLSFTFDEALTDDDKFEPVIYYFNEETQELEALETTVSGNTATAQLSHFSKYILLNRIAFEKAWQYQIKPREMNYNPDASLDIVFVVDYSMSMEWNDPNMLFRDVCKSFVEKLRTDKDKAGVVKFIKQADVVCSLTSDKNKVTDAIDSIKYDFGFTSKSGTNGSDGLYEAIRLFSKSTAKYKYIVFLTDGEDTKISYPYDELIKTANVSGISIYTIGMGDVTESVLRQVASETGGKYFYATAGAKKDDIPDLDDVFHEVESETIDYTSDINNDGISDYYTKTMCEGKLRTDSGTRVFDNKTYDEIQNGGDDFDGDKLKNGDEISIETKDGKTTVKLKSSPVDPDTDNDGIPDNEDSAPFDFGLYGGVVGYLTVASADGQHEYITDFGHSWLLFKSAVNTEMNLSGIDTIYKNLKINRNEVISIGSSAEDLILSFKPNRADLIFALDPYIYIIKEVIHLLYQNTIESYAGEIHINWEFSDDGYLSKATPWGTSYGYKKPITKKQLDKIIEYWNKNNYYNVYTHNCASIASEGWNRIFFDDKVISDVFSDPFVSIDLIFDTDIGIDVIDMPIVLKNSISEKNNYISDFDTVMLNSKDQQCKTS